MRWRGVMISRVGISLSLDGAMDEGFLKFGKHAGAAGGGGHELQLFGRVDGAFVRERRVEEMQHGLRGAVHEANGGPREADEDVHGSGDGDGDLFGLADGEGLRDELAEQDLEIGDEGEGHRDGDEMRVDMRVRAGRRARPRRRRRRPARRSSRGRGCRG